MLSEAINLVLGQGYCVLHIAEPRFTCSGLTYKEWATLIDLEFIKHQQSRLMPDDNPSVCWERYRVTPAGRQALDQPDDQ